MSEIWTNLEKFIRSDWVNFILAIVLLLLATAVVSKLVTTFLRKLLHYNKENNLPSSSIFVNIARAAVWILGICTVLSTCFNVDISAMIAALGVGGIAVSLGFQNTLSNLIAGLQISLMHIVKPGDVITVTPNTGVVKDVNWWNTAIIDNDGNTILIPNSKLVTSALVHLLPSNEAAITMTVTVNGEDIDEISQAIESEALHAAALVGPVLNSPSLEYSSITDDGFSAALGFAMVQESDIDAAKDAIIRRIAPFVHATDPKAVLAEYADTAKAPIDTLPPAAQENSPDVVNARIDAKPQVTPLVTKKSSPTDVAAATVSTLEGVILGRKTAKKRVAHVLSALKPKIPKLQHSKVASAARNKKHKGKAANSNENSDSNNTLS